MMREPYRARPASDAALLLLYGIGLLVRHVSDHAAEVGDTTAYVSRGVDAPAMASATERAWRNGRGEPSTIEHAHLGAANPLRAPGGIPYSKRNHGPAETLC